MRKGLTRAFGRPFFKQTRLRFSVKAWRSTSPALEAPEVVGVLARSSQKAVAMAALQAAGPRDFAAAFRTVAAHDPAYAIAVLEERIDALASVLRPDDIAPLLDIADESLRLRAIGLLRALRAPRSRIPLTGLGRLLRQ